MNGKVILKDLETLAEFLKAFTGSTAVFEAYQCQGEYVVVFKGGC